MQICLYGASSSRIAQVYLNAAYETGALFARRGHTLVFGGGANGVMGAAARGAHDENGTVIGVAPSFFNVDGILFSECTQMIYTETMRQRKQKMDDLADAFVLAPGGIGSFEEFFEILTLKQLGKHNRPIGILNTNGYYDPLEALLRHAAQEQFMAQACLSLYRLCETPQTLLEYLENDHAPQPEITKLKHI